MIYDYVVGIDPDVDKNGVAVLRLADKGLSINNLSFPECIERMIQFKSECDKNHKTYMVVVEAGWTDRRHWHTKWGETKNCSAAKGDAVGRNHEVGRKLLEMFRYHHVECTEQPPLKKCWLGADGKITHDELAYFTGYNKRNNQEGRDAALLAWCYANLPIKIDYNGITKKTNKCIFRH